MKRIWTIVVIAVLVGLSVAAQLALLRHRPTPSASMAESAFAAFGGFRSIISEIIWFRADRLYDEGNYVELAELARALTLTEPHTPEVWGYAAWNLAYNVSVMMPTAEDSWHWVDTSIRLLRDDGLKYNPRSGEIYKELAMLFEFKLGLDVDRASPVYRAKWKKIVDDVAARDAWEELGMNRVRMAEVEAKTGIVDRTSPFYSSSYWALEGLAVADRNSTRFLHEVIRQSVVIYHKKKGS